MNAYVLACFYRESDEQDEQDGHEDVVRSLYAPGHSQRHDDQRRHDGDHHPCVCSPCARRVVEGPGYDVHVLPHPEQVSAERHAGVFDDPGDHAGVSYRQGQGSYDRYEADALSDLPVSVPALRAHPEGAAGSCAGGAAEGELAYHAGCGDQDHEYQVRDDERHAAPQRHHGREAPDVPHPDG